MIEIVVANISKFLFWKRITTEKKLDAPHSELLQIYQSSFFESESQHLSRRKSWIASCCKYIKVPFLKANHNRTRLLYLLMMLLQIYQSSFFESESQHLSTMSSSNSSLLQIYQSSFFESESQLVRNNWYRRFCCCKYIKVPFLKANHNKLLIFYYFKSLLQIYQSSFFESESQQRLLMMCLLSCCCKYIKVPFLKANHNMRLNIKWILYVVANISKFLFWKRITTSVLPISFKYVLLQIYQSSFFESESQQKVMPLT